MNHNKARMLVAGWVMSLSGAVHASVGVQKPFSGGFSQLAASYQGLGNNTSLQGFSCTAAETISAPMLSDEWQQAFRDVLHMSAANFAVDHISDALTLTDHGMPGDVGRNFRRIEILLYAQTQLLDVAPKIEMPTPARETALVIQARYNSVMQMGMNTQAQKYPLADASGEADITPEKMSDYGHYLNPCLNSSKRFVAKVVAEFRAVSQEA